MHVAEHCITNLKSLKAVVKALKLERVSVPEEIYKRIVCENIKISCEEGDRRSWSLCGYSVHFGELRVFVDIIR